MRAVKSVLLAAGALKRAYPKAEESELVLRAIIDVNLPKFLAQVTNYETKNHELVCDLSIQRQDIPLFEGIYSDLFPGIEVPKFERGELVSCMMEELRKRNLQATPWFVEKIMQIYEMILVRHGLMIVGGHMAGKTSAYQVTHKTIQKYYNSNNTQMSC